MKILFHILCAGNVEDKIAINALVNIREMLDDVKVTKEPKAPVGK